VDVEPREDFCKCLMVYFFDMKNQRRYYLREGDSSVEYSKKEVLYEKVKRNADRRYNR
jgi:hypothetical protein